MALHEISLKDGSKLRVEGPENATVEQLLRIHNAPKLSPERKFAEKYRSAYEDYKPESGILEDVTKGLAAGAVGTYESAALGAAAALDEDIELKARSKIKNVAEAIRPDGGDPDSVSYKLASGIGSILAFAPTAVLGPAALPAAGILGIGAGAGEATERARAAGATEDERGAATLRGAAIGATEILPLGRIFKQLELPILKDMEKALGTDVVEGFGDRIKNAAITGGAEGAQEATAAVLQNMNERGYNLEQEVLDSGVSEEALIGGGAGAILQFVADLVAPKRRGATTEDTPPEETPPEETPPEETLALPPPTPEPPQVTPEGQVLTPEQAEARIAANEQARLDAMRQPADQPKLPKPSDAIPVTPEGEVLPSAEADRRALDEGNKQREERDKKVAADEASAAAVADMPAKNVRDKRKEDEAKRIENTARSKRKDPQSDMFSAELEAAETLQRRSAASSGDVVTNQTLDQLNVPKASKLREAVVGKPVGSPEVQAALDAVTLRDPVARERVDSLRTERPSGKVTKKVLDAAGVKPQAPIRKAVIGKELGDPDVRKKLIEFANNPAVEVKTRQSVANLVEGAPQEQQNLTPIDKKGQGAADDRGQVGQATGTTGRARRAGVPPTDGGVASKPDTSTTSPEVSRPAGLGEASGLPSSPDSGTTFSKVTLADSLTSPIAPVGEMPTKTATVVEQVKSAPLTKQTAEKAIKSAAEKAPTKELVSEETTAKKAVVKKKVVAKKAVVKKKVVAKKAVVSEETTAKKAVVKKKVVGEDGTLPPDIGISTKAQDKNLSRNEKGYINTTPKRKNPVTDADETLVYTEVAAKVDSNAGRRTKKEKMRVGVQAYFGKGQRIADALADLAYDIGTGTPKFRSSPEYSSKVAEQLAGRGGDSAINTNDWVLNSNLSAETKKYYEDQVAYYKNLESKTRKEITLRDRDQISQREQDAANAALIDSYVAPEGNEGSVRQEADIAAATTQVHPSVMANLRAGDLKTALFALAATTNNPRLRQIAMALAPLTGTTSVRVADAGDKVAQRAIRMDAKKDGSDPKNIIGLYVTNGYGLANTIILNAESVEGVTPEVLLHEMTHAATLEAINNNPNSPVVKQLNQLYELAKTRLGTNNGTKNLQEFVAEAYGNPKFRAELADIYPDARDVSVWERFKNIITNWLRSLPTPMKRDKINIDAVARGQSAADATDALIARILSPAPDLRSAPLNGSQESVRKVLNDMGDSQQEPAFTARERTGFIDKVMDFLSTAPDKSARALFGFAQAWSLADIAKRIDPTLGKLGTKLHATLDNVRAELQKVDDNLKATQLRAARWAEANPDQLARFNSIVYKSTTEKVDPTKPASKYKSERRAKIHKELREEWAKLDPEGRKVYIDMRDSYKALFDRLKAVVLSEAGDTVIEEGEGKGEKLGDILTKKLFAKSGLEPYFPLMREGGYKLVYRIKTEALEAQGLDEKGMERDKKPVEMFHTKRERDRRIKELESNPDIERRPDGSLWITESQEAVIDLTKGDTLPPTGFVRKTLEVMTNAKVDKEVTNQILTLYLDALPESAAAKSLQQRAGTPGYIPDAIYTFNRKGADLGRQVARIETNNKLRGVRMELTEHKKITESRMDDDPAFREKMRHFSAVADDLILRADYGMNPETTYQKYSQGANRLAFMFTIGFNASSALVNASQIPLFVLPYYGAEYGYGKTTAALKDAASIITSSGTTRKLRGLASDKLIDAKSMPSLENYFTPDAKGILQLRTDLDVDANMKAQLRELQPLVQLALDRNQLSQSVISDQLDVNQAGKKRTLMDKATYYSAFMFHNVERYNRQVALTSAYLLETQRMKAAKDGAALSRAELEAAADAALQLTQKTNGGSVSETGARWAQGDVGRVALMYKQFGLNMYYTMLTTSRDAFSEVLGKKEGYTAFKQMLGIHATAIFFAGIQGVPLYGAFRMIANLFLDDDEEDIDTLVRNYIGEGWYKGAVTAATGADVSQRLALTGLLIQMNRYNQGASPEENILHYLGGPAWSTMKGFYRGTVDIQRGEYERGFESFVPAAVRNAYKGLNRYPRDGGALTRRGDPIFDDMTSGDLAAQVLGFAPKEYTLNQERNMVSKRIERTVVEERSGLLKKYYVARRMRNYTEARQIRKDMREFSRRHRGAKITTESIEKSMAQHMRTSDSMYNGVTINPLLRKALEEQRDKWE